MKLLEKIKDCPLGHHSLFSTNRGFDVRKVNYTKDFDGKPLEEGMTTSTEKAVASGEFADKWANEREPNLYVPENESPKTQRQFFYWKYWQFMEKFILTKFPRIGTISALDVGCGRGTISQYLQKRAGVSDLYLLDNDEGAIKLATQNLGDSVTRIIADATDMPIKNESIDLTVSIGVLEHVENYIEFLKEQYRVLKMGGVMVCLILPQKKSAQMFNLFGTLKYDRSKSREMGEYKMFALQAGFKFFVTEWVAPYPIFTPVPMWLDKLITKVYLKIDWLRRNRFYSFSGKERWAQGYFFISQKL